MAKIQNNTKRILFDISGFGCIAIGLLLSPLPGPWSIPMYILGLSILAKNYTWAHTAMDYLKQKGGKILPEKFRKHAVLTNVTGLIITVTVGTIIYVTFIR